ncbi:MAG: CehA/McbA family metallohydrolase [Pirellulales bacterium]|nr:CehA/McbA family metallohydrolase [Pirellulales bacterium]
MNQFPRKHVLGMFLLLALSGQRLDAGGQLELIVVDKDAGKPVPCRMHLYGPKKDRPRRIPGAPFWHDHSAIDGRVLLRLPNGRYEFLLERGLEYLWRKGHFTIEQRAEDTIEVDLRRFVDMSADGWWSGDLDVRRPAHDIELLMAADDLHVAQIVTWRNDKSDWNNKPPEKPLVRFDNNRFYHLLAGALSRAGTDVLSLNWPTLPNAPGGGGEYPPIMQFLSEAREGGNVWIDADRPYWWDLPVLAALDLLDSVQTAGGNIHREGTTDNESPGRPRDRMFYPGPWGNARWAQHIYFQLLECGFRIPPTAGSGSGLSPNPVGYNRVYVQVDGELAYEKWWDGLRAGRCFVTNGPLLKPSVNGRLPGHVFRAAEGTKLALEIGLTLSTRDPISYLEIVKNGQVAHSIPFDKYSKEGHLPKLTFERSGWFLVRAVTDLPKTYCFAMTGPYYVEIGNRRRISRAAVQFFLDWLHERARRIEIEDPQQKREVLAWHRRACDFWKELLARANAE